jgi:hypothetical protein
MERVVGIVYFIPIHKKPMHYLDCSTILSIKNGQKNQENVKKERHIHDFTSDRLKIKKGPFLIERKS